MTHHLFRPFVCIALAVSLVAGTGCASSGGRSDADEFGTIRTGSYIPRRLVNRSGTRNEKPRVAKAKRQKASSERAAAPSPADEDYVTRGGFR
jgi:hypothetical protein